MSQPLSAHRFALIDELLPDTVRLAAATVPMYASLYREIDTSNVTRERLVQFPTVGKADLISAGANALSNISASDYYQNTSGSTGQFLTLHRSNAEQRFIQDFFLTLSQQTQLKTTPSGTLFLGLPSHGTATAIPSCTPVVTQGIVDARTAENVLGYLGTTLLSALGSIRIQVIAGAATQVLLLTKYLAWKGHNKSPYDIKLVIITGDWVSSRTINFLETFWNAKIVNRFSCSEAFGGATSPGGTGLYEFDPIVHVELVSASSLSSPDTGELILTTLFPFVQRQPLIRYRTGDIFSFIDGLYKYHGRLDHCLFSPLGELIISGTDFYNLVDNCELIARQRHGLAVPAIDHSASGKPIIRGEFSWQHNGALELYLYVGTVIDMHWFSTATSRITNELSEGLRTICTVPIKHLSISYFIPDPDTETGYDKAGKIWKLKG